MLDSYQVIASKICFFLALLSESDYLCTMIKEYQIRVRPEVAAQEDRLKAYLADEDGLDARTINGIRILKRSIDARQRQIFVNLKVRAYVNEMPADDVYQHTEYPNVEGKPQVIVVGLVLVDCLLLCDLSSLDCVLLCWSVVRTCTSAKRIWQTSAVRSR